MRDAAGECLVFRINLEIQVEWTTRAEGYIGGSVGMCFLSVFDVTRPKLALYSAIGIAARMLSCRSCDAALERGDLNGIARTFITWA